MGRLLSRTFLFMLILAVLMTGGYWGQRDRDLPKSAEIYHPDSGSACILPDLPDNREGHTQNGLLLCGGVFTDKSCRKWNTIMGSWDLVTESLTWFRQHHTSWTPENGSVTYLMGGSPSAYPSEIIDLENGQVNESFPLQNPSYPLQ